MQTPDYSSLEGLFTSSGSDANTVDYGAKYGAAPEGLNWTANGGYAPWSLADSWGNPNARTDGWLAGQNMLANSNSSTENGDGGGGGFGQQYNYGNGAFGKGALEQAGWDMSKDTNSYSPVTGVGADATGGAYTGYSPEFQSFLQDKGIQSQMQQGEAGWESRLYNPTEKKQYGDINTWGEGSDDAFGLAMLAAGGLAGSAVYGGAGAASGFAGQEALQTGAGAGFGTGETLTGTALSGAGKGALVNGGKTAIQGGDLSDIFKSAATGAVMGGVGAGAGSMMGQINPAGMAGVTDPTYAGYINKGLTSAGMTAAQGGGLKQIGSGLMGAGLQAGVSQGLNAGANMFGNSGFDPNAQWNDGGSDMSMGNMESAPSMGGYQPGPATSFMNNLRGTSQPQAGSEMSSYLGSQSYNPEMAQPSMDYSSGTSGAGMYQPNVGEPNAPQTNPLLGGMKSILSFNGGNGAQGQGGRFDNMAGGLLSLYNNYQQRRNSTRQMNDLQSLYTPNSAYSQEMQKQMMRADAKSGRRSNVGGRQVELQAKLAELNSRNAPQIDRLNQQNDAARQNQLFTLAQMGGRSGLGSGLFGMAQKGLGGMFGGGSAPQLPAQDDWNFGG